MLKSEAAEMRAEMIANLGGEYESNNGDQANKEELLPSMNSLSLGDQNKVRHGNTNSSVRSIPAAISGLRF